MLLKVHFNKCRKWEIMFIVVCFATITLTFFVSPKFAEAKCNAVTIDTTENNMTVPVSQVKSKEYMDGQKHQAEIYNKICVMDGEAQVLAEKLRADISSSTIKFVRTDFGKGNPAFVQNTAKFNTQVGDSVAGNTINNIQSSIAEPFRDDTVTALKTDRVPGPLSVLNPTITTEEYNNITNGTNDSPSSWYLMTQYPQNNQYGSLMLAKDVVNSKVNAAQAKYQQQLDWGRGYLSYEYCPSAGNGSTYTPYTADQSMSDFLSPTKNTPQQQAAYSATSVYGVYVNDENCLTLTPGATIQNEMDNVLSSDLRHLEVAQSYDQTSGQLTGQLLKQSLGGTTGLAGASLNNSAGYNNTSPAIQNYVNQQTNKTVNGTSAFPNQNNFDYQSYLNQLLGLINTNSNGNNSNNGSGYTVAPAVPTIYCVSSTSTVYLSSSTLVTWVAAASGGVPPFSYSWLFTDGTTTSTSTGQSVTKSYATSTVGVKIASASVKGADSLSYTNACSNTVTVKP